MKRAAFWIAFGLVITVAVALFVKYKDPLHNHPWIVPIYTGHQIKLLSHPHPEVAAKAWEELWNLYYTRWSSYDVIMRHLMDMESINILITRESFPEAGEYPAMQGFYVARHPVFYKSDAVYCRTVGEALMAIVYREGKWKTQYEGDWDLWWRQNKMYYPKT